MDVQPTREYLPALFDKVPRYSIARFSTLGTRPKYSQRGDLVMATPSSYTVS